MYEKNLLDTFIKLAKIDSVSGEENDLANYICEYLGYFTKNIKRDSYGNVIAKINGQGDCILLNAHMDTVEPGRKINPVIKGDKIFSDGSTILGADPKAGISIILEAVRIVHEKKLHHKNIEIIFTREEEVGLRGVKQLNFSILKSKMGVVFDGEEGIENVTIKGPGYNAIDVTVLGKASHAGASPEKGISSIKIASEIVSRLSLGRLDQESTANVGFIQGGSTRNAIPAKTTFLGEIRSHSSEKIESNTKEWIHTIDSVVAKYPGAKSEIKIDRHFDPYAISGECEIIHLVTKVFEHIKIKPQFITSGGGTDAHIFNKNGIQTVVVGTGGYNAHTTEEYVFVSEMKKAAEFCLQLILA